MNEGAFLALAGQAQGRFMNQLEGQAGLHRGGVAAAPITEKIPAAQAQVLGHEQPDAHPVTGDFVAKQLAHRALQATRISGFETAGFFGALGVNELGLRGRKRKVKFFFEDRSC